MATFKENLQASLKSNDTEEWIDVYFTRPIGLVFAMFWNHFGVHPNVITILSIFLGAAAGWMFYYPDLAHNVAGMLLLIFANFCDSTDGQMARLTGKKTLVGRMLDGFSGDVWFACIYVALALRLQNQLIPGTDVKWGVWIWALCIIAGALSHSPQSSLADYYRQIHLFFLKGRQGSELDSYAQQRAIYEGLPKSAHLDKLFYYNYANYCKSQERRTPQFQVFFKHWEEARGSHDLSELEPCRQHFLAGSRRLMPFTNLLTFNSRAICLYAACLLNLPWIYPLFEIIILNGLYIYMHKKHEALCQATDKELNQISDINHD